MFPLSIILRKLVQVGTLNVVDAKGRTETFGNGKGPKATMRLHDPLLPWKILLRPELSVGEGYMKGTLSVDDNDGVYNLLYLITKNAEWRPDNPLHKPEAYSISRLKGWFAQVNPIKRSIKNVARHYDLSGALYDLFLDKDKQYSCAYYTGPGKTLEDAQADKKAHIAKKLLLDKGHSVLDIGSGWGGLGLFLHKTSGAKVTGITLSKAQLAVARERAEKEGASDKVQFRLQDYREVEETFDRIVSVGMFEHVGRKNYGGFFKMIYRCLEDDGVALLHTIGRADGPGATDQWTGKYIFPGGYAPALSEIVPHIEKAGLYITDLEVWRLHYAETLKEWRARTWRNRGQIIGLYNEEFLRMWDFYLSSAECAFRNLGHVVYQIQLAKKAGTVPLTRDYMYS